MTLFVRILVFSLAIAPAQVAYGGEWKVTRQDQSFAIAAFEHDDGAELAVICDVHKKLIILGITEPRANWVPEAPIRVVTKPDSGVPLGQSGQPDGIALKPTVVLVLNPATLHLTAMGLADSFFAVSAGDYGRLFPITGFKRATGQVLQACGDHW
jgi:hypothetical protein